MACIEGKKLSAYADGELPEDDAAAVSAHLAHCPACREELSRLALVSEALAALEGARPDPYFASRLKNLALGRPRGGWARRALVPAAATAVAALSLVLGAFLGRALYAPANGAAASHGELVDYLGVAPVEDFPDGSLGEAWGQVWAEGDG